MGGHGANIKIMYKVEQVLMLIAFFAMVMLACIGIYYAVYYVPLVVKVPLGVFLGAGLLGLVFRVIRKSL